MSDVKLSADIFNSPNISRLSHSIRILSLTECTSTQNLLLDWWENQTNQIDYIPILYTSNQLRGIGQKNRTWISNDGSLTFSILLPPHIMLSWTPLEMALLCRNYFAQNHQVNLLLKWPNDLVDSQNNKIGGIICHGRKQRVVVGIGLNLFNTNDPNLKPYAAGHIFNTLQKDIFSILKDLCIYLCSHRYEQKENLKSDWLNACSHLNQNVVVLENDNSLSGNFEDLGEFGQAIIRDQSGVIHQITNGSLIIDKSSDSN